MARRRTLTAKEMIERGGYANFIRAVRFSARYSGVAQELGHLPTLIEYQQARGMSVAQAYREQKAWRDCVGDDTTLLETIADKTIADGGWSEADREDAIARWLVK